MGGIGTAMITSDKKQSIPLYITEEGKICYNDILRSLQKVGVQRGDIIFGHSDVSVFGKIGDIKNRDEFLGLILQAFKKVVGKEGIIIMPTFSYSFCRSETYDPEASCSRVGALTTYFRKQRDVVRTIHPIFSVGIWGKEKGYFNSNLSKDSFDKDSIFGKLHKKSGKILFFGASFQSCTFVHYIEQLYGIPYRYMKTFKGKIKRGDIEYEDEYTFFVRYLDKNVILDTSRLEKYLLERKSMKEIRLGNGRILMIESDVLFKEGYKLLDHDIYFFLKGKPNFEGGIPG